MCYPSRWSKSPSFAPSRNARHSASVKISAGPPGYLELRIAAPPSGSLAVSTQLPCALLRPLLHQLTPRSSLAGMPLWVSSIRKLLPFLCTWHLTVALAIASALGMPDHNETRAIVHGVTEDFAMVAMTRVILAPTPRPQRPRARHAPFVPDSGIWAASGRPASSVGAPRKPSAGWRPTRPSGCP